MRTPAKAAIGIAVTLLLAWLGVGGLALFAAKAHAQAPKCGGNSKTHPAPIDCENSKVIDGIGFQVRLVVDETGYVMVTAVRQAPPLVDPGPWYLQVKAHVGISSNPGFVGGTDPFDGNTASLELQMPACTGQIDIKAVSGDQPTTAHVSPRFRIAAPLVGLPDCGQPTTTATTAPTTTSPTSSTPTVGSTVAPSTTPGPGTVASVPGPGDTLPATGRRAIGNAIGIAAALLLSGALVLVASRRRATDG